MADQKITDFTEVTSPALSDFIPVVDGGVTKKVKIQNILNADPTRGFTTPVLTGYAWVNQGTCSGPTTNADGSVTFIGGAAGSGANIALYVRSMPATPYDFIAYMESTQAAKQHNAYGLVARDSSTGRVHVHGIYGNSSTIISRVTKYTTATSFSADYQLVNIPQAYPWIRLVDDGANFKSYLSANGDDWLLMHTIARTNFLATPDQIGYFMSVENATTPNLAPIVTVRSASL